jgi:hypothetical protein
MASKASLALALGIMALAGWGVYSTFSWPWKAALFPLVIGIPLFCMAAAEVLWVLFGAAARSEARDYQFSTDLPAKVVLRRTLLAIAWIGGFFATIVLLGFPVAVPLLVFLYLKVQGGERWGLSLVFTVAVWAVFHGLFDRLLHLPFPDGLIVTWFGFG